MKTMGARRGEARFRVATAAKAALASQKEEDKGREEKEKQARESMQKTLESELEKHSWRLEPLGSDRDQRRYWLLAGKGRRIFSLPAQREYPRLYWLLSGKDHRIFVQHNDPAPEVTVPESCP
ncbi:hypothetical protein T484DRAFT_1818495 [Baffinella frigidus]|nr:hypothetical protein T484DRAFT_1818495 [Cryptophyta sp. CCMP2293]